MFRTVAIVVGGIGLVAACRPQRADDWPVTGGGPSNDRYSVLDQITTENVRQLKVAWIYHTGDAPSGRRSEIQATPIVVDGVLYTSLELTSVDFALQQPPGLADIAPLVVRSLGLPPQPWMAAASVRSVAR